MLFLSTMLSKCSATVAVMAKIFPFDSIVPASHEVPIMSPREPESKRTKLLGINKEVFVFKVVIPTELFTQCRLA